MAFVSPFMMQWTAPAHRHLGAKMRLMLRSGLSLLMAMTYRQRRLRATSAMASGSDIPVAMSDFELISSALPPGSDVTNSPSIRGVMTQPGHWRGPVRVAGGLLF